MTEPWAHRLIGASRRRLAFAVAALIVASASAQEPSRRVVVTPSDTGGTLVNPGMSWMFHHYDDEIRCYTVDLDPSDRGDEFPGVTAVYIRLAWSFVEPAEGQFN